MKVVQNINTKAGNNYKEKIEQYLSQITPEILGLDIINSVEILEVLYGSRNLNFHVRVNQKDYNFRINIEHQIGPIDQIEYEFNILNFLRPYEIAPRPYHFDKTKTNFNFGIMIQEYLAGPHLSLKGSQIQQAAKLLAKLHSIPLKGKKLLACKNPLKETRDMVKKDLIAYEAKEYSDRQVIDLVKEILEKTTAAEKRDWKMFAPDCLNHKDVVCDNVIKTTEGLKLIDWEKPRVDDCSYDICCVLSQPAQLWCSQRVLSRQDQDNFMGSYARAAGKNKDDLIEKVQIRQPLVSLHWILWAAIKLCDFRSCRTVPELLEAHNQRIQRFEAVTHPENIEKILSCL